MGAATADRTPAKGHIVACAAQAGPQLRIVDRLARDNASIARDPSAQPAEADE